MSGKSATPTILIDNDQCRLTLWSFEAGQETGWHTHEMDYVVMPKVQGKVRLQHPDGTESVSDMSPDAPYFRPAGVNHNVINASDAPFSFLELEFKQN
jgi:quercetin dioxygenase-like cupin family protein